MTEDKIEDINVFVSKPMKHVKVFGGCPECNRLNALAAKSVMHPILNNPYLVYCSDLIQEEHYRLTKND